MSGVGSSIVLQCTTLVRDVDNGEGYAWGWAEGIWEISVPSTHFYCDPKTSLKLSLLKKIVIRNPTQNFCKVTQTLLNLDTLASYLLLAAKSQIF